LRGVGPYNAAETVLYWAPQPSYPYATTTAGPRALATNPNGTICLLGVG